MIPAVLSCPVCALDLEREGDAWRCGSGHSFDTAREGYVNLLTPAQARRAACGDTREMLAARRAFLDAGHYRPLLDALAQAVGAQLRERAADGGPPVVLDTGCGEGYYVGGLAQTLTDAGAVWLGGDISREAVRAAARRYPAVTFLTSDVHERLCVPDGAVAILLDVFAPRDPAEFARVLEPGGCAFVAIPGPDHLAALRERLGLLDIEEDKEARLLERFAGGFTLTGRRAVEYPLELSPKDAALLVEMGPNRHHEHRAPGESLATRASFVVLRLACVRSA